MAYDRGLRTEVNGYYVVMDAQNAGDTKEIMPATAAKPATAPIESGAGAIGEPVFIYVGQHRGQGTSTNAGYVGRHHKEE